MTPMTLPSTERRAFIAALAGGLLGAPRAGWAQAAKATRVVGHLAASSPSPENTRLLGAFHAGLRERGWIEGQTVSPEQTAKLVELLAEILGVSRMGVILSTSYPGVDRYRSPLERVAASRQNAIRFVEVRAPENLDGALATLRRLGVDGLVVMTDQVMQVRGDEVLE